MTSHVWLLSSTVLNCCCWGLWWKPTGWSRFIDCPEVLSKWCASYVTSIAWSYRLKYYLYCSEDGCPECRLMCKSDVFNCFVTFDQPVYIVTVDIVVTYMVQQESCTLCLLCVYSVVVCLRGFHLLMSYLDGSPCGKENPIQGGLCMPAWVWPTSKMMVMSQLLWQWNIKAGCYYLHH